MKVARSYNLDQEIIEWLKKQAESQNRSVSWIVNEYLRCYRKVMNVK